MTLNPASMRGICSERNESHKKMYRYRDFGRVDPVSPPPVTTMRNAVTTSLYDIPLKQIDGAAGSLAKYGGKVLLVVNVASKCGLTPQYNRSGELVSKQTRRRVGKCSVFPATTSRARSPAAIAEIRDFCSTSYDVHFPLFLKNLGPG